MSADRGSAESGSNQRNSAVWIEQLYVKGNVGPTSNLEGNRQQGWTLVQEGKPKVSQPVKPEFNQASFPEPTPQQSEPTLPPTPPPEQKSSPPPAPEEESWEPMKERRSDHPFYQDMNDGEDPNSPTWKSIKEEMAKKQKGEMYGHQEVIDNMDVVSNLLKNGEIQKIFPKKSGENDESYNNRLLHDVITRLRFHGEYGHKKDPLYVFLQQNLQDAKGDVLRWDEVLMGAEALDALAMEKKMKAYEQEMYNLNFSGFRRSVLTEVFLIGDERRAGGGTDQYFGRDQEGNLTRKELPQMDLTAFEVVGQIVMDIGDPALGVKPDGKPMNYAEHFKYLQNIILSPTATSDERNNASVKLAAAREQFYINTLDVLGHRHEHNPYRDESAFRKEAHTKLRGLMKGNAAETIENLLKVYETGYESYHGKPMNDRQRKRLDILRTLPNVDAAGHPQDVLDFALKGGDLMRRRAEKLKEPPEKPPKHIFRKKLRQAGIYRGRPVEEEEPEKPAQKPPQGETPQEPGKEGGKPVEPEKKGEEPGEGGKKPGEPEPAPAGGEPPQLEELKTDVNFGAAGLKDRRVQNVLQIAQHLFSHDLNPDHQSNWYKFRDKILGWSYKVPLAGGVVRGMVHPVQMIWQNGLARSVFEQQWIRFSSDAQDILKKASDTTVPVDVNPELMEKALEEGRKIRKNQNILRQAVWKASDTVKGVLGVSQTSEQKLAKQWLQEQVAKPADQRDGELTALSTRSLDEQNKLGDRYARFDSTLGLDRSNRAVLAKDAGEMRHKLSEQLDKQVNEKLKAFIERYATGALTEEQLVKEVNTYLLGEFKNGLSADLQKEFSAPEAASNILSIARYISGRDGDGKVVEAGRWQRYHEEKVQSGKTKWEELHLNVLFGKSEWGGARGKVEMGFIADRLARRLAERPNLWDKVGGGAWATTKDLLTNGAFFAAGYGASAVTFGSSLPLRMVGGFIGMAGGAAFKETGIGLSAFGIKGIKGRYIKEVEQLSREIARGREDQSGARIRPEMKKALVTEQMREATALAAVIEGLLKKDTLSSDEAKKLLFALADADARMRLSDLSGSRKNNFKVQNYIKFNEGKENDEYDRLKGALLNGMVKLSTSGHTTLLDSLDKYSGVAEAQLRFSSEDAKQVRKWLVKDANIPAAETDAMMNELNLHVQKGESLRGKNKTLFWLTMKRGVSTMVRAAATGVVAPVVYAPVTQGYHEIVSIMEHVQHAGGNIGIGIAEWQHDWSELVNHGVPPVEINPASGSLESTMTPLQRSTLWVENIIHPPAWTPHDTSIDGGTIQFPGELNYIDKVDTSGVHHYGIVDLRNGQVFDLKDSAGNNFHLGLRDVDNNGTMDLVLLDKNNTVQVPDAGALLEQRFGIHAVPGGEVTTSAPREIVPAPDATHPPHTEELTIDPSHKVTVETPWGTNWAHDGNKFDLVTVKPDGTQITLLDNVTIKPNGDIDLTGATNNYPSILSIDHGTVTHIPGGSVTMEPLGPDGAWTDHSISVASRQWMGATNDMGYMARNQFYAWKMEDNVGQPNSASHLVLDFRRMADSSFDPHSYPPHGVTNFTIDGKSLASNEHMGIALSLSGDPKHPVIIQDSNGDGLIDFGQKSPDHVLRYDSAAGKYVEVDSSVLSPYQIGQMITDNKMFADHDVGRVFVEHSDVNDHSGLGALSLQDPAHSNYFGTAEVVKVTDGTTNMQVFATIRGSDSVGEATVTVPPLDTYNPAVHLSGPITEVVETKTSTIALEAPGFSFTFDWLLIASRQNIEKSERKAAVTIAPATVQASSQQVSQPQQTQTPTIEKSEEEKRKREEAVAEELKKRFTKEKQEEIINEERKKMSKEDIDLEKKTDEILGQNQAAINEITRRYNEAIQGKPPGEWDAILGPIVEEEYKKANIPLTQEEFFRYRAIKINLQDKLQKKVDEEEAKIRKEFEEKEQPKPKQEELPQQQAAKLDPKDFKGQEKEGSVQGATPLTLDGKPSSYEIYADTDRAGAIRLRKTSVSASSLEAIAPNGSISYIGAAEGQVINENWNFKLNGKFYSVKDDQFIEISDPAQMRKIEERIEKFKKDNGPKVA